MDGCNQNETDQGYLSRTVESIRREDPSSRRPPSDSDDREWDDLDEFICHRIKFDRENPGNQEICPLCNTTYVRCNPWNHLAPDSDIDGSEWNENEESEIERRSGSSSMFRCKTRSVSAPVSPVNPRGSSEEEEDPPTSEEEEDPPSSDLEGPAFNAITAKEWREHFGIGLISSPEMDVDPPTASDDMKSDEESAVAKRAVAKKAQEDEMAGIVYSVPTAKTLQGGCLLYTSPSPRDRG